MREIIFRGKMLSDCKKWKQGDLVQWTNGEFSILVDIQGVLSKEGYDIDPLTIGQYTGVSDKKGNPIYEGDLVRGCMYNGQNVIGKVIRYNAEFVIIPIGKFHGVRYRIVPSNCIVLGTIYD